MATFLELEGEDINLEKLKRCGFLQHGLHQVEISGIAVKGRIISHIALRKREVPIKLIPEILDLYSKFALEKKMICIHLFMKTATAS